MSDILNRLLAHNAWTTRQLLERACELSPQQLVQRFDIGPGSVHDTLLHIIDVMFGWADRIAQRQRRPRLEAEAERRVRSVDELVALLDAAAEALNTTARAVVNEDRMDDMMSVTFEGRSWQFTRGTALVHVLTHGMHHRAQVFNMMRQLGAAVDIDGDAIEWEIGTRAAARTE